MILPLSTTSTPEISTVTGSPYKSTRLVIRRPSAKMIDSFSWTDLAIVVREEDGCSKAHSSSNHVEIGDTNNIESNSNIEKGSKLVIRRASILFSWTGLVVVVQE
jgi:hypothetical protein